MSMTMVAMADRAGVVKELRKLYDAEAEKAVGLIDAPKLYDFAHEYLFGKDQQEVIDAIAQDYARLMKMVREE